MSRRLTFIARVRRHPLDLAALTASRQQDAIAQLLTARLLRAGVTAALVVCAGGLLLVMFRERLSRAIDSRAVLDGAPALLVVGYSYRFELQDVTERVMPN